MDNDLLLILRHSLGFDENGRGHAYRNHFVTGEGCKDYDDCTALVALGFMTVRSGSPLSGGDDIFRVSDAGRAAVIEHGATSNLSRSKQRYQDYLNCDDSLSFIDWLKMKSRQRALEAVSL